ncbi:PhyH-domain-containing protein [Basidiobolus meristosporus CBS 931.73]|uniref:PhyH-domain-containing protein n=1 Tax=Basidiobolus meristosporus CBS 931.73 TaxID=1314790 RepID=A0A1Y1XZW5_9FUNG|nr:PhyH-domain-containing protein [Basidiobolus meristosporus CBS 931.73]ORX96325.1 PhyH-domain-containing protein [Basidiobolus meristosporus CBS 931.73]|eukprot:ORX91258.1 PhyH-domain-containing protein [Basidiobolus meristosporus CBS 931.73]
MATTSEFISAEQKSFYDNEGYIILKDYLTPEETVLVASAIQEIREWPETKGKWMRYYENNVKTGERQLCRIENFTPFHEALRNIILGEKVMTALEVLTGEPAVLFKEKINFKMPGGGGFPAHQDAPAFTQFGQSSHVTVMFGVDPFTIENGCLWAVPKKHKLGVLPQEEKDGSISVEWCEKEEWVPLTCGPRDVLIFGAYLPHRSGPNNTEKNRTAVYLTYNAAREGDLRNTYYDEKRRLFPPAYEREQGIDYSQGGKTYNLATPIVD